MADLPEWLPGLVLLQSYGGNWQQYVEAIYSFFCQDFIGSAAHYRDQRVVIKRLPMTDGKETTFWHLVSEGSVEAERTPDLRRCERIRWPRPVIEHSEEPVLKVWENERHGERRVCLWLETAQYLVVLAPRKDYVLLWTAYTVTQPHQQRKLEREYQASRNG